MQQNDDQRGRNRRDEPSGSDKGNASSWNEDGFEDDDSQLKFFGPGARRSGGGGGGQQREQGGGYGNRQGGGNYGNRQGGGGNYGNRQGGGGNYGGRQEGGSYGDRQGGGNYGNRQGGGGGSYGDRQGGGYRDRNDGNRQGGGGGSYGDRQGGGNYGNRQGGGGSYGDRQGGDRQGGGYRDRNDGNRQGGGGGSYGDRQGGGNYGNRQGGGGSYGDRQGGDRQGGGYRDRNDGNRQGGGSGSYGDRQGGGNYSNRQGGGSYGDRQGGGYRDRNDGGRPGGGDRPQGNDRFQRGSGDARADRGPRQGGTGGSRFQRDDRGGQQQRTFRSRGDRSQQRDDRRDDNPDAPRRFDPNRQQRPYNREQGGRREGGQGRDRRSAPVIRKLPGTTLLKSLVSYQWASRALALQAIQAGRIGINDEVNNQPNTYIKLDRDTISVDGRVLQRKTVKPIYVVFNKPHGLIGSKEEYRRTLYSFLSNKRGWFIPNGVLPKSSAGIVIVTNDPEHRNLRRSKLAGLSRDMLFKVHRQVKKTELTKIEKKLREVWLDVDADTKATVHQKNARNCWIKVAMRRGRITDVTKVLKEVGLEVLSMERQRVGPFSTEALKPGAWHRLTDEEVVALDELTKSGTKEDSVSLASIWQQVSAKIFKA